MGNAPEIGDELMQSTQVLFPSLSFSINYLVCFFPSIFLDMLNHINCGVHDHMFSSL